MSYNARTNINDESDVEEEALVNDYREQVNFDDGMSELDRTTSLGGGSQTQDLQAQLAAAATPLEYQATLETKFASYDNYCSLFHYILNSDGPVDLEVPSVCYGSFVVVWWGWVCFWDYRGVLCVCVWIWLIVEFGVVLLGMGCYRRVHLPIRVFLSVP